MMEPLEPEIIKGFLLKRGSNFFRGWKKRFFVFEKGVMKYYSTYPYEEENVKKVVNLADYKVEINTENTIYLSSEKKDARDFFLVADERTLKASEWYTLINDHIEYAKENRLSSLST